MGEEEREEVEEEEGREVALKGGMGVGVVEGGVEELEKE